MFDIGWTELLVIAVVAVLVVGPRELPGMLRTIGNFLGQMRRMAGDFQRQFNDAIREAELDEVKKGFDSVRSANALGSLKDGVNPIKKTGESVREAIEQSGKPKTAKPASAAGESGPKGTAAITEAGSASAGPSNGTGAAKPATAATPAKARPATKAAPKTAAPARSAGKAHSKASTDSTA